MIWKPSYYEVNKAKISLFIIITLVGFLFIIIVPEGNDPAQKLIYSIGLAFVLSGIVELIYELVFVKDDLIKTQKAISDTLDKKLLFEFNTFRESFNKTTANIVWLM